MNKKKIVILVAVAVVVIVVIFAKGLFKEEGSSAVTDMTDMRAQYEQIKDSGRPVLIAFTYDAECCPGTREFFDDYNGKVRSLIKDYEKDFDSLFINIGILTKEDEQILMEIAMENNASRLPTIVLRDRDGPFKVIEGPFDDTEVRHYMDGMVKE